MSGAGAAGAGRGGTTHLAPGVQRSATAARARSSPARTARGAGSPRRRARTQHGRPLGRDWFPARALLGLLALALLAIRRRGGCDAAPRDARRPRCRRNRPRQGRASPLVPVARLGWPRRGRRSTGDDSARQGRLAPARAQLAPGEGAASPRRGRGRPPGDGDGGSAPLAAAGLAPGGGGYSSWAVRVSKP